MLSNQNQNTKRNSDQICQAILAQIGQGVKRKSALKENLHLSGTGINKYLAKLMQEEKIVHVGNTYELASNTQLQSRALPLPQQLLVTTDGNATVVVDSEPRRPAIAFENLTASEHARIFSHVKPRQDGKTTLDDTTKHEMHKISSAILRQVRRNRAPYDATDAGALSNLFYWLESPNLKAALRKSYRESKRIMHVDCLLCENGACHGIMHYKVLPLNALVDGCTILRCQNDISKLKDRIINDENAIAELKIQRKKVWGRQASELDKQIENLYARIQPTRRKIWQYQEKLQEKQLEILPLELAINGIPG